MFEPAATYSTRILLLLVVAFVLVFTSCSTIKDYPNRPFVYETNVKLNGKFSTDERKDLQSRLQQQLHDSTIARRKQTLGFWSTLKAPPAYDSLNADKSVIYMRALLNSLGYFRDTITYDTTLHTVEETGAPQQRVTLNFNVYPGILTRLDSISYALDDDTLQQITTAVQKSSVLHRRDPFAKALIGSELDRLTDEYRNNGYLLFSRDELLGVFDTVGLALLRPTLDPLEQAEQLEALRQRREQPTADLEIVLRASKDSTRLTRYYVGNTTLYPDINVDTSQYTPRTSLVKGYKIIQYKYLYEPTIFPDNIYLQRGDLYSQRNYLKTLNRFNALGSWRLVSIDQVPRAGTDTVDFVIHLTPANKYSFNANLEGSQNLSNTVNSTAYLNGNLIGVNLGLQNRNFARRAYLSSTNLRIASEVSNRGNGLARQVSVGHTITIPKELPTLPLLSPSVRENAKTLFGLNAAYTSLPGFFDVTNVSGFWGYDFNWNRKLLSIRIPNIEYTYLRRGPGLIDLINGNRAYEFIYNSGLVSSFVTNFTIAGGEKNTTNVARFGIEASGLGLGLIRSKFLSDNLQRFIKLDAEFRQNIKIGKSAFAWRVIAGAGFQVRDPRFKYDSFLPFYKSYVAGGSNSMRAWALRRLGPGSTVESFDKEVAPYRFGEMALEGNAEYRFYIADVFGFKVNSALFTDMGNIWYLRKNSLFPDGQFLRNRSGDWDFGKLWTDLAIGVGTGLRVDLGFFLIRVDYAFKMKDPSPSLENWKYQNKFFADKRGVVQLGVTYPF